MNYLKANRRCVYFVLLLVTIFFGLASRTYGAYLPDFIARYAGDTLWAAMVYWGICFLFPSQRILRTALCALLFSYCIEVSQLYQADWINAIRATRPGALVLGHGFLWTDLICYTVGVLVAACIDKAYKLLKKNSGTPQ